jgi:hypothetical protein
MKKRDRTSEPLAGLNVWLFTEEGAIKGASSFPYIRAKGGSKREIRR